jgi:hypothetical protein
LIGENSEAVALAEQGLAIPPQTDYPGAMVWKHPADDGELELMDADDGRSTSASCAHIVDSNCQFVEARQGA